VYGFRTEDLRGRKNFVLNCLIKIMFQEVSLSSFG
jgi:hypothetical protein